MTGVQADSPLARSTSATCAGARRKRHAVRESGGHAQALMQAGWGATCSMQGRRCGKQQPSMQQAAGRGTPHGPPSAGTLLPTQGVC